MVLSDSIVRKKKKKTTNRHVALLLRFETLLQALL